MTTEIIRKTGIPAVGDVPWGTHFCHFYQTQQDLYEAVIPYLKAGLEGQELCLWITAETSSQAAMNVLGQAIPDFDRYLDAGDLEILLFSQWYCEGESFDSQRVINSWSEKLAQALAKGYAGLRVAADAAWLEKKYWKVFSEYEKKLDQAIAAKNMLHLCAYPLAASEASTVFDVTRTHRFTIAQRDGSWDILEASEPEHARRKRGEEEHQASLWFLESMDRVNRAMQGTNDLEQMMSDVLDTLLSIFDCDRAYLLYPCDPESTSWSVPMERTRPEYPGVLALGQEIPMDKDVAETFRVLLNSPHPVKFGPGTEYPLPTEVAEQFGFKSFMSVALYPKVGKPWQFGIHQCSYPRTWTPEEERLLQGIGQRLADTLTSLLAYRNLQESELRYRELFENSLECIFLLDVTEDGRFKYVEFNPAEEKAVGFPNAEVSGKFIEEAIPTELAQQVMANYRRCVEAGTIIDYDEELSLPVGRRDFHTILIPVRNAAGDIYRIIGIARDTTEQIQTEQELQRSNDLLRAIIEAAPVAIIGLDLDGNVQSVWNPAAEKMLGWSSQEALGRPLPSVPTESREEFSRFRERIRSGQTLDGVEVRRQRRDGSPINYSINASPLRDTEGRITGNVAVLMDITERKRVQSIMQARLRLLEFAGSHSMDELLTATLDEIETLTGSTIGFYHFLEPDQKTLSLQSWSTNTLKNMCTAEGKGRHYDIAQAGVWVDCIHERRPVIHDDYASLPHRKGLPDGHAPVNREVVVPIFRGNLIKAIIGVGNKSTPYDESDIEIVSQLGDLSWDIAERKRAEESLRESEKQFRLMAENSTDMISLHAPDGIYLYVSPACKTLLGYEPDELVGHSAYEFFHPEDAAAVQQSHTTIIDQPVVYTVQYRIRRKDGRYIWFETTSRTIRDSQTGAVIEIQAASRDITARKQAEADLHKLSQAVEQSPASIIITDAVGNIEYVNPKFTQVTGYTQDEAIGKNPRILKSGETPPEEYRRLWNTIAHGDVWQGEFHNKKKNGELYWESASISPVLDSQGNIEHFIAVKEDITERKRAEDALRDSEARYRAIVEAFDGLIYICSQDYRVEFMNRKLVERTGYDGTGKLCYKVLHDIDTVCPWCVNDRVFSGETVRWEIQSPKDGRWYYVVNTPIHNADGSISKQAMIQDITERKQRERELEALVTVATALRAALRRDEVLRIVADQVFDLLRTGGVALLLRSPEADELVVMTARGAWEHWIDVHLQLGEGISGHVVSTGQPYVSDDVRMAALSYRPDLISNLHAVACVPLMAKGEVIGVLWVGQQVPVGSQDVRLLKAVADMAATAIRRATLHEQTQRHAAELEERVAERTRELAEANTRLLELDQLKTQFVSNVSHELRTPITNLKLHLDLLMRGKPEKREHHMTVLKQQANRLTQLVEDILDLSRLELGGGEIAFAQVDLNQLVDQVVTAHQAIADHADLHLIFEPGSDLPPVRGEVNQLAQVVTNLVINALNYTPAGSVQVRTYLEGDHVCLDVEDTGIGIDPEDLLHLFERFYRGKGVSQGGIRGTGLGLAIVKEIVDLHKGSIEIDSQQGKGTTFTVRLPLVE